MVTARAAMFALAACDLAISVDIKGAVAKVGPFAAMLFRADLTVIERVSIR